jgi:hypothetical protein
MSGAWPTDNLLPHRSTRSLRVVPSPDREEREEQTPGARGAERHAQIVRRAILSLPSQGARDMNDDTIFGATAKNQRSLTMAQGQEPALSDHGLSDRQEPALSDRQEPAFSDHGQRALVLGKPAARVRDISWEEPKPAKSRWAMVREHTKKTKAPAFADVVCKSHGPWHSFFNMPITRKNHFLSLRSLLFA